MWTIRFVEGKRIGDTPTKGEIIQDFRHNDWEYLDFTPPADDEPWKSGYVNVRNGDTGTVARFYPQVLGLKIFKE